MMATFAPEPKLPPCITSTQAAKVNPRVMLQQDGLSDMGWQLLSVPASFPEGNVIHACMQVKESTGEVRPARGPTGEEILKEVLPAALQGAKEKGITNPVIAMDNTDVHTPALATLRDDEKLAIPTWSPDFMKVIEHNHSYVVAEFERELDKQGGSRLKPMAHLQLLERVFKRMSTAERVGHDVDTLQDTYGAIIAAGGDYPAHHFR